MFKPGRRARLFALRLNFRGLYNNDSYKLKKKIMASVSMTESLRCGRVSNKSDGQWNIKLLILRAIAAFLFFFF